MTKLLVLSDSHGGRAAIERVLMKESKSIDALIFLGHGLRDLELALTLYPKLRAYSVAGNCDYGALEPTDGLAAFDGVVIFYNHGHMYGVKYDLDTLADAACRLEWLFGCTTSTPQRQMQWGKDLVKPAGAALLVALHRAKPIGILTLDEGKVTAYEHKEVPKQ